MTTTQGTDSGRSPALTVAAVAKKLGVAPATLRTWDRRYGLGPTDHAVGAHRRYTQQDVERLLIMRRLTSSGVAPADAAKAAIADNQALAERLSPASGPPTVVDAVLAGEHHTLTRLLRLDADDQVLHWWTNLVQPALELVSRRTVLDRAGADASLSLHWAAVAAINELVSQRPVHPDGGVVLLWAPGSIRPLAAHVVAAAVSAVDVRLIGGPVSSRHLLELVIMTKALALVTIVDHGSTTMQTIAIVADQQPDLEQLVLAPAESFAAVPNAPAVQRARSVAGLIHELQAVVAARVPQEI